MTDRYVRSTDGDNGSDGLSWANAYADVAAAAGVDAAGDTIWISDNHAESLAAAQGWAFAGTKASPTRVLCADDSAEPPTALATTATVTTTGTNGYTITGECVYFYGITWNVASGAVSAGFNVNTSSVAQAHIEFERCKFVMVATGSGTQPNFSFDAANQGGVYVLRDCDFKFGVSTQGIVVYNANWRWVGGTLLSGTATPSALFEVVGSTGGRSAHILIEDVDLSAAGASMSLFAAPNALSTALIRNSKLPASWSGNLVTGTLVQGARIEMRNCDAGDTNYRMWIQDYFGSIKSETTLVRTGGATDGTTAISWRLDTSAACLFPMLTLDAPEIYLWNETIGSQITATIEILHDGATNLKDDEIWLEARALTTSGYPLGALISDAKANVLATAADQTTSAATWTTTGMTNPNEQKLSVSFTPQEKGWIVLTVRAAKASATIYVCPKVAVS